MRALSRWWRLVVVTGMVCGVLVVTAGAASAHAELVGSTPAGGSVLGAEPASVTLRFSEEIVPSLSAVEVIGPEGRRLDVGAARPEASGGGSGVDSLVVTLAPDAGRGTFVVEWRVTAADDGHAGSGDVMFAVGAPSAFPVAVSGPGHDRLTSAAFDAGEWLGFAGLALATGFVVVRPVGLTRPLPMPSGPSPAGPGAMAEPGLTAEPAAVAEPAVMDGPAYTWPATLGWIALLAGTLVQLATYAPSSRGSSLGQVFDRSLWAATLATREGHALMARLLILAVAAFLGDAVLRRGRGPIPVAALAVFTLGVAATWGVTGHAATGSDVPLAVAAVTVHVAAMAVWLGGLFAVTVALMRRRGSGAVDAAHAGPDRDFGRKPDSAVDPAADLAATVARFSRLALAAVATLAATGAYQGWREIGDVQDLTDTTYGRLLLAKIALLLAVIVVARRSRAAVARWNRGGEVALRRTVLVELAAAAVLLLLAVLLAGNAPARDTAAGSAKNAAASAAVISSWESSGHSAPGIPARDR